MSSAQVQAITGLHHARPNRASTRAKLTARQKLPYYAGPMHTFTANEPAVQAGTFKKIAMIKIYSTVYFNIVYIVNIVIFQKSTAY